MGVSANNDDRASAGPAGAGLGGQADLAVSARAEPCVIGVDFGTLSGRALVVRVRDGAELGSAIARVPARRDGRGAGGHRRGAAARLGPAGPARTMSTCCGTPCPRRSTGPESTRPRSSASARTSPRARCCRCCATGPRCASCRTWPAGRTPTSSCGSTTPPSRTPTGSTPWPPSAASRGWPGTAARSPRSGSSPRACSCWRRTRRSTSGPTAGSRPPTGSSGSCAAPRPATPAPPGTRASTRTATTRKGISSPR